MCVMCCFWNGIGGCVVVVEEGRGKREGMHVIFDGIVPKVGR